MIRPQTPWQIRVRTEKKEKAMTSFAKKAQVFLPLLKLFGQQLRINVLLENVSHKYRVCNVESLRLLSVSVSLKNPIRELLD